MSPEHAVREKRTVFFFAERLYLMQRNRRWLIPWPRGGYQIAPQRSSALIPSSVTT
jgi:hypothetical protein